MREEAILEGLTVGQLLREKARWGITDWPICGDTLTKLKRGDSDAVPE